MIINRKKEIEQDHSVEFPDIEPPKKELRIIIAGGRDFDDYELLENSVNKVIDHMYSFADFDKIIIVSGCANGADKLGERYAKEHEYEVVCFPANWSKYGKAAGAVRNVDMAEYAECGYIGMLIAFWDGKSSGTKHMIKTGYKNNLEVNVVRYKNNKNNSI